MKKSISIIALLVLMAICLIGCNNDLTVLGNGTLTIEIGEGARGLEPISMETASYNVTVKNSNSDVVYSSRSTTKTSHTMSVSAGTYSAEVEALNSDGVVIGKGVNSSCAVVAGQENSFSIIVREEAGEGTFSISITANEGYEIAYSIKDPSGSQVASGDLVYSTGRYIASENLDNGFYLFTISRKDNGKVLKYDTVRIVKDKISNYSAEFTFLSDGSFTIVNEVYQSPSVVLTLSSSTPIVGDVLTVSAAVSGIENYSSYWVMDGAALGDAGEYADLVYEILEGDVGEHEIVLFVNNGTVVWSGSCLFSVSEASSTLRYNTDYLISSDPYVISAGESGVEYVLDVTEADGYSYDSYGSNLPVYTSTGYHRNNFIPIPAQTSGHFVMYIGEITDEMRFAISANKWPEGDESTDKGSFRIRQATDVELSYLSETEVSGLPYEIVLDLTAQTSYVRRFVISGSNAIRRVALSYSTDGETFIDYDDAGELGLHIGYRAGETRGAGTMYSCTCSGNSVLTSDYPIEVVEIDGSSNINGTLKIVLMADSNNNYFIRPRYYTYNPETDSSYGGDDTYSREFRRYYLESKDMHMICYPHSIYMAYILGGGTGNESPDYAYSEAFYWYLKTYLNITKQDICAKIADGTIDSWLETLTANYPQASSDDVANCQYLTVYPTVPETYSDSDELIIRNVFFYKADSNFLKHADESAVTDSDKGYIITDDWGDRQVCWVFLPYSYLELYESSHSSWDGSHHIIRDYMVYKGVFTESEANNYNYTFTAAMLNQMLQ